MTCGLRAMELLIVSSSLAEQWAATSETPASYQWMMSTWINQNSYSLRNWFWMKPAATCLARWLFSPKMFSIRNSSIGQPPIHFLSKQFAKPNFNLFGVYSVTKFRSFASTKKSAHGKKHAQDTVPDSSSNDDRDIAEECRQKMSMSLDKLRADFAQLRLGRANPCRDNILSERDT